MDLDDAGFGRFGMAMHKPTTPNRPAIHPRSGEWAAVTPWFPIA
jgi:hypothetical protein